MGLFKAFGGAISGTFADQWRDIITVESFNETIAVRLGTRIDTNRGNGANIKASDGVISNGSKIYVPENTIAVVFDSSGIEGVVTDPGGYEYHNGEKSILAKDGFVESIIDAFDTRFDFGGQPSQFKKVIFLNLRELRGIKFGTHGPLLYHDSFYETDLEVLAHGTFSIQITKPVTFIQNYLPVNTDYYDFADKAANSQIISELTQSMVIALNKLSKNFRLADIPGHIDEVTKAIVADSENVGAWEERYGFQLISVSLRNVEPSPESRELIRRYNDNRMSITAYENVSSQAADIAYKLGLAQGVKEHGLGDGAGVLLGMNMVNSTMKQSESLNNNRISLDEQIEAVKKFKELLDIGAISQEEFDAKKKEIMGL